MDETQLRDFILRLRKLVGCPITWEQHFEHRLLCKELRIYWIEVCKEFQVDGEARFYQVLDVETSLDERWLKSIEANVPRWRERAVKEYESRVGFLTKLSHLDRFGYAKHFPPSNLTKEQIIGRTGKSASLFFPEVTIEVFHWLFECVLSQKWLQIVTQRPLHVFLTSEMEIGGSNGAVTNTIRFDIDYSTPTIHSHPRQPADIPVNAIHVYDENFDAGCFDDEEFANELTLVDIDEFKLPEA